MHGDARRSFSVRRDVVATASVSGFQAYLLATLLSAFVLQALSSLQHLLLRSGRHAAGDSVLSLFSVQLLTTLVRVRAPLDSRRTWVLAHTRLGSHLTGTSIQSVRGSVTATDMPWIPYKLASFIQRVSLLSTRCLSEFGRADRTPGRRNYSHFRHNNYNWASADSQVRRCHSRQVNT